MNKTKWKLNGIDILLTAISVVIIAILANMFFINKIDVSIAKKQAVTMVVTFKDVANDHTALINENESAKLLQSGNASGTVIKSEVINKQNTRGIETSDSSDVKISIESQLEYKNGKYYINGTEFNEGDEIEVFLPGFSSKAIIESFTRKEE